MDWLRWYHGTSGDPKWRLIAKHHETPISAVLSVWATMLESASQNTEHRGTLQGWEPDEIAAMLDLETSQVQAIYDAMQGRILEGNRLINWEKRQPKREREDYSTERVKRHRAQVKHHETPRNTTKHLEESRGEESREDKKGNRDRGMRPRTGAPSELTITDSMRQWAQVNGITADLEAETAAMLDHHGGKGNLFVDWVKAWRTWMRNTKKFGGYNGNGNHHETKEERIARKFRESKAKLDQSLAEAAGDSAECGSE